MSSRSGQPPIETTSNDLKKSDLGASAPPQSGEPASIEFNSAKSSEHPKPVTTQKTAEVKRDGKEDDADDNVELASVGSVARKTIPLPEPKADPSASGTRVVVTQGEQKTALTTSEEALRLMPPGPDFAAKVQSELARLGCYRGRVDNIWGPMSRNAVARFNRTAQANLPLKQPTRALLSSARKAPDGYCTNGGSSGTQVAALDTGAALEDVKKRPEYLPPWMRGEPMPEPTPQDEQADAESEAEDTPQAAPQRSGTTRTRRTQPSRTERSRARERRVQRRQVRRRQAQRQVRRAQRSRQSWQRSLPGWPGSSAGR